MKEIYEEVLNCEKCRNLIHCKKTGMKAAVMQNHDNAKIMFIALNPGVPLEHEIGKHYEDVLINSRMGKMFIAKFLEKAKLKYEDIYWSNVVKCSSPENREITQEEMNNCFNILQKQVNNLKNLTHITVLGKLAIEYLKEHKLELKKDIEVIDFYHPSYIFRSGQYILIDKLAEKINFGKGNDITQIQNNFSTLHIFSRGEDGNKVCEDIEFQNYFYVKDEDVIKVLDLIENRIERSPYHQYYEPKHISGFKSIYEDNLTRIIPSKFEYWKIRDLLWSEEIKTYEIGLSVDLKYLLSSGRKYNNMRRVGIIDIENDMSLDAEKAPVCINAITIYNYQDEKYYTWILGNPQGEEIKERINKSEIIYKFENHKEDEMLSHFIEKFREFDFDAVGGWNSSDFDFPYIINRIKRLGLDVNRLSRFSNHVDGKEEVVSCRSFTLYTKKGLRKHFNSHILGVELIDFMPILAKNMCYKSQPSSWSLKSTAKFYLEEEYQKLIKIGAGSWKTDINNFITYNIKDVDIVRELIDRFKLIDFFLMIQCEVAPVPLNNVTHNSVVLLYHLKMLFKDRMLPDNPKYAFLEKDKIDLKKFKIKMKAAHVINAVAGRHENVSIFDFAGLYPSIFRTFNISPETIGENGVEIDDIVMWKLSNTIDKIKKDEEDEEDDVKEKDILNEWNVKKKYSQEKVGRYPILLKELGSKRDVHKKKSKEFKKLYGATDSKTILEEARQDVLKQIANSLYGVNGFNKTILFNPIIGASVTSISRKLIKHVQSFVDKKEGFKVITGDTDSLMIKHPVDLDIKKFGEELNNEIKRFINERFPDLNKNNYNFNFEHAKTYKKYVMKEAKKRYYGILDNGEFSCKGFCIIQHVLSNKIKDWIKEIYIMLMDLNTHKEIRDRINEIKKEFYKLDENYLYQDINLANDPDDYSNNCPQAVASKYSNTYLGTRFKGGTSGKLIFIKNVKSSKYPKTDLVLLDEDINLPLEFEIDYDLAWEKLFIDNIKQLDSVPEFKLDKLFGKDRGLEDWIKGVIE